MSVEMALLPVLLIVVVSAIFIMHKGRGVAVGQQKKMAALRRRAAIR